MPTTATPRRWVASLTRRPARQILISGAYWAATLVPRGREEAGSLASTSAGHGMRLRLRARRLVTDHYHSAGQAYWVPGPGRHRRFGGAAKLRGGDVREKLRRSSEFYQRYKLPTHRGPLRRRRARALHGRRRQLGGHRRRRGSSQFMAGGCTGSQNGYESDPLRVGRVVRDHPRLLQRPELLRSGRGESLRFQDGRAVKLRSRRYRHRGERSGMVGRRRHDLRRHDSKEWRGGEPILFQENRRAPELLPGKISCTAEPVPTPSGVRAESIPDRPVANGPWCRSRPRHRWRSVVRRRDGEQVRATGICAPLGGGSPECR